MARVPRKPDLERMRNRERLMQERLRKKEIEDLPAPPSSGGGALGICAVDFAAQTNILAHYQCLRFDHTVINEGGFTIDTAYPYNGGTGTAIRVPADGIYQFGLMGEVDTFITNPSTSGHSEWDSVSREPQLDVLCDTSNFLAASFRWIDIAYFTGSGWAWLGDPRYKEAMAVSRPVELLAGDPILSHLNPDSSGLYSSINVWNDDFSMWVVRLT